MVVDDRTDWNAADRFPRSRRLATWDDGVRAVHERPDETMAIVMTCSHDTDFEVLKRVLARPPAFTGLIGSRSKRVCLFGRLVASGIDEAVVQTAAQWFDFKEGGNVKVHVKDGRQFVKQAKVFGKSWDFILLDAFNGDYIPEHLMTREFLEECRAVLAPNGVLVANTFSSSRLYEHESATYAAVFGRFINLKREDGNRIIVVRNGAQPTLAQHIAFFGKDLFRTVGVAHIDGVAAAVMSHGLGNRHENRIICLITQCSGIQFGL